MSLASFRKSIGLTQSQLAKKLGRSEGYLSSIETGRESCPISLALRIDELFQGEMSALDLVSSEDARLLHGFAARAAARSEPRAVRDELTIGGRA